VNSPRSRRNYKFAMEQFITWYCSNTVTSAPSQRSFSARYSPDAFCRSFSTTGCSAARIGGRHDQPAACECDISQVKAVALEAWLKALSGAPATKAKTRNVLSSIYQHARRCEFIATNPVSLVRQSAVRLKEPEVLTPEEVNVLLDELVEPARTIVHLAATTGIGRGELFALKWQDVDLEHGRLKIVRSIVDQSVGDTKTRGSKRPLPMSDDVVAALSNWRSATDYGRDEDWVFASPQLLGEKPYWPKALLIRQVLPAADRAGITKRIGWHTFRHTFATLLQSSGAGVKVTQELLRHSSPVMTLGTYA
jgi:integrase